MLFPNVHIERFRCFEDTRIEGFKAINLIGGQNNAGKTALLEALLLAAFPHPRAIHLLRVFREESEELLKSAPSKVWNFLFFEQEKERPFVISSGKRTRLEVGFANGKVPKLAERYFGLEEGVKFKNLLLDKLPPNSALHFHGRSGANTSDEIDFLLIVDNEGDLGSLGTTGYSPEILPFLHTRRFRNQKSVASLFSEIREQGKESRFMAMLKLLDARIEGAEIDSPGGEPLLKLKSSDGVSVPSNLFGDGVRRMIEVMLVLLSSQESVILIDEIENGLHYSKHREVWKYLLLLAIQNGCQLFATSHSFEMIKAFSEIGAMPQFGDNVMYFEMGRGRKSGNIVVNPMNMAMLRYEIANGLTFRGE